MTARRYTSGEGGWVGVGFWLGEVRGNNGKPASSRFFGGANIHTLHTCGTSRRPDAPPGHGLDIHSAPSLASPMPATASLLRSSPARHCPRLAPNSRLMLGRCSMYLPTPVSTRPAAWQSASTARITGVARSVWHSSTTC